MSVKIPTPENFHVYFTSEQISARLKEVGKEITEYYETNYPGEPVLCVGLLRGAIYFMVDITREMGMNLSIDFMTVTSYGDERESSQNVRILKDLDTDINGKNVLIIEDIIDTGHSLTKVLKMLKDRNPKSLKVVACANKPSRREVNVEVDWICFEVENKFLVGYGFDDKQYYRNIREIGYVDI